MKKCYYEVKNHSKKLESLKIQIPDMLFCSICADHIWIKTKVFMKMHRQIILSCKMSQHEKKPSHSVSTFKNGLNYRTSVY